MSKPPDQPVVLDSHGTIRFRANAVVEVLREAASKRGFDLNDLARAAGQLPQEDWEQFYQLIGYSICGYHELSFVSDAACERASAFARAVLPDAGGCRDDGCEFHCGVKEKPRG